MIAFFTHSLNHLYVYACNQSQLKKMEESLEEMKAKLDESREQLKTNENGTYSSS